MCTLDMHIGADSLTLNPCPCESTISRLRQCRGLLLCQVSSRSDQVFSLYTPTHAESQTRCHTYTHTYSHHFKLAGLPLCTTEPLQRVLNAAARLIFQLSPSQHITPSLLQLHWLPMRWRVQFKLCCFMHAAVTGRCRAYWGSIVQPATQSRSGLRPSSFDFSVPRTRTKFGERAFSYADPSVWNSLACHIRETVNSDSFRKLLKTHYFTSVFGVA